MDFTVFTTAIGDVTDALGGPVLTGMAGVAVASLVVGLTVRFIKRVRSAV